MATIKSNNNGNTGNNQIPQQMTATIKSQRKQRQQWHGNIQFQQRRQLSNPKANNGNIQTFSTPKNIERKQRQ